MESSEKSARTRKISLIVSAAILLALGPPIAFSVYGTSKKKLAGKLISQAFDETKEKLQRDERIHQLEVELQNLSETPLRENTTSLTAKSGRIDPDTLLNGGEFKAGIMLRLTTPFKYYSIRNNYRSNIASVDVVWGYDVPSSTLLDSYSGSYHVSYPMRPSLGPGEVAFLDVNPVEYLKWRRQDLIPFVREVVYEDGTIEFQRGANELKVQKLESERLKYVRNLLESTQEELGLDTENFGGRFYKLRPTLEENENAAKRIIKSRSQ